MLRGRFQATCTHALTALPYRKIQRQRRFWWQRVAISNDIQSTAIQLKGSVMTALYETDLVAWAREQADLARRGSVNSLDLTHIAEELEGMVRAEHRALASQIERLMAHLLKWRYQPERRSRSWRGSIRDSRTQIERLLGGSPSLGGEMLGLVEEE